MSIDLSDNRAPFYMLTHEEKEHLKAWPHGVEAYQEHYSRWASHNMEAYHSSTIFRTKPPKKTKRVALTREDMFDVISYTSGNAGAAG